MYLYTLTSSSFGSVSACLLIAHSHTFSFSISIRRVVARAFSRNERGFRVWWMTLTRFLFIVVAFTGPSRFTGYKQWTWPCLGAAGAQHILLVVRVADAVVRGGREQPVLVSRVVQRHGGACGGGEGEVAARGVYLLVTRGAAVSGQGGGRGECARVHRYNTCNQSGRRARTGVVRLSRWDGDRGQFTEPKSEGRLPGRRERVMECCSPFERQAVE